MVGKRQTVTLSQRQARVIAGIARTANGNVVVSTTPSRGSRDVEVTYATYDGELHTDRIAA